ncbi:MAG: ATP-binding protein [Actinophytocola sp.]|nr:ATP-binding protein [Actinophytocola sp.]
MTTHDPQHHASAAEASGDDNVVYLPATSTDNGVVETEIVDDTEARQVEPSARATFNTHLIPDEARARMASGAVELSHRAAPAAKTGGKALVRHGAYVVSGAVVVAQRVWEAHTNSRYERLLRAAEASGDWDKLAEWEQRAEQARERRHRRAMDWLDAPVKLVKTALLGAVSVAGFFLAVGVMLALANGDARLLLAPLGWLLDGIGWAYWFALAYGVLLVYGGTAALVAYLWRVGRDHGSWQPAWLSNPAEQGADLVVLDEDSITRALSNCHVTALNRALKAGAVVEYLVHPREQGGGTYTQVRLPLGVKAADFLHPERIETLAGNLGRHKHEVYPQRLPDGDARVLDLWVADRGTMDKPAPAWPLLAEGEFDVFRDRLPWGVTMRGEQVAQGMLHRHVFFGALSKQGKTATMRRDALGLALDPTVELRIADLKGDGDWSMFAGRARTLIEGGGEQQAAETCLMLDELVAEMQRRYDTKRAMGIKGNITRELSRRPGSGFHPIYCFIDECQVLYQADHPIGGTAKDARAWKAARRIHDQARAVNIHLYQATQRPDPSAVPFQVREGAHVRACLHVANHEAAKMVLADAADRGARPQDLRSGKDAGTVVAAGEVDDIPEGQAFIIVRSHYVGTQEAYTVINRAMDILAAHGRTVDQAEPDALLEPRDLLTDLATVLEDAGMPRMRTQEVLQRLAELAPATYREWTFTDLRAQLADTAAAPYKSDGVMVIAAVRIQEAITDRDRQNNDAT